jgi:hypothetical protein
MARIEFEFDPEFDDNLYRASNKSGSSLKPLYDQVRRHTDEVYVKARESIAREAGRTEAKVQTAKGNRFSKSGKHNFNYYKASASALKSAKNSIHPVMGFDGKEIYGRVAIFRKNSDSLEYGGVDPTAEIGKGTGVYVEHPAYAFLRRALDSLGG